MPSKVFKEEVKTFVKVKSYIKQTTFILTVDQNNAIRYKTIDTYLIQNFICQDTE